MKFLIESLIEIILDSLKGIFVMITTTFLDDMQFNVGSNFTTEEGVSRSLIYVMTNVGKGNTSLFDQVFGQGLQQFMYVVTLAAVLLATIIAFFQIYKVFINPDEAKNPLYTVLRYVLTVISVFYSYHIFAMMEFIFNKLYLKFMDVALSAGVIWDPSIEADDFTVQSALGIITWPVAPVSSEELAERTRIAEEQFAMEQAVWENYTNRMPGESEVIEEGYEYLIAQGGPIQAGVYTGQVTGVDLLSMIVAVVVLFAIIINFFKLLLEVIERYLIVGFLFYTAPLPFACLASETTVPVFNAWVRMCFSQVIVMLSSAMFLSTFLGALGMHEGFANYGEYLIYMFMLTGWLLLGQRVDGHLKGLGLNTAQAGSRLFGAALGASAAIFGATRAITLGKQLAGGAKSLSSAISGKINGKETAVGGVMAGATTNTKSRDTMNEAAKHMLGQKTDIKGATSSDIKADKNGKISSMSAGFPDQSKLHIGDGAKEMSLATGKPYSNINGVPVYIEGASNSQAMSNAVSMAQASRNEGVSHTFNRQNQAATSSSGGEYNVATSGGNKHAVSGQALVTDANGNETSGTLMRMNGEYGHNPYTELSNGADVMSVAKEGQDYAKLSINGEDYAFVPDKGETFEGVKGHDDNDFTSSRIDPQDGSMYAPGYFDDVNLSERKELAQALSSGEFGQDAFEDFASVNGMSSLEVNGEDSGVRNADHLDSGSMRFDDSGGRLYSDEIEGVMSDIPSHDAFEPDSLDAIMDGHLSKWDTGGYGSNSVSSNINNLKYGNVDEKRFAEAALNEYYEDQIRQSIGATFGSSDISHFREQYPNMPEGLSDVEQRAYFASQSQRDAAMDMYQRLQDNGLDRTDIGKRLKSDLDAFETPVKQNGTFKFKRGNNPTNVDSKDKGSRKSNK